MPVNGCCALTQVLSVSLHSKRGKPVSHRNLHCDLSITPSASPSCKRNCPAISAAASVPLICSLAETATTRSPDFAPQASADRKSTRLNSSHGYISYAVFCLKKKNHQQLYTLDELP